MILPSSQSLGGHLSRVHGGSRDASRHKSRQNLKKSRFHSSGSQPDESDGRNKRRRSTSQLNTSDPEPDESQDDSYETNTFATAAEANKAGRTRPTNNQLLYKAHLNWEHYPHDLGGPTLRTETEACASVTSAFLQVLAILFTAELHRVNQPRNILKALARNTRRTKVVDLSSGTHRVPEELRRHSLIDGEGGEYSTNLDRNRYGGDNQYLATVIRYNLEFLDLCPCLVDVEIIQCKGEEDGTCIAADLQLCNCMHRQQAAKNLPASIPSRREYGRLMDNRMHASRPLPSPSHVASPLGVHTGSDVSAIGKLLARSRTHETVDRRQNTPAHPRRFLTDEVSSLTVCKRPIDRGYQELEGCRQSSS
ncbi:hypothetical protein WJX84_009008 [Apatococcus fuscideae]|uniref:Uncharacterized protein n=1 Tax=Apatococcus fuscideae TaxID=2026836 RepID=A0AAW1TB17_9CHLO